MNTIACPSRNSLHARPAWAVVIAVLVATVAVHAAAMPALLDDFSDAQRVPSGAERFLVNDKELGSQSQATQVCADGVLTVKGELAPGRGVPAFISVPLLLSADAKPQDLSAFTGIRLRVKATKGILTVQVASADIENFDYHTSGPITGKSGEFQEVRIPFGDLKRGWSEQTALNLQAITSVNLVAFGLVRETFVYEVDEIGFY